MKGPPAHDRHSLPALTGLRFFLALWVIVYHLVPATPGLTIPWIPWAPDALSCLLRTGYVAVTVFFALSGFVLAYNYDLGRAWHSKERRRFAVARFSRIYPAYLIALLSLVPVAIYRASRGIPAGDYALPSGFLNLALLQAWSPRDALSWNYPGWSLSCEALYYALFPIIGAWMWKARGKWAMLAGIAVLWGLSMAGPVAALALPASGLGGVAAAGGQPGPEAAFWVNLVSYNPLAGLPAFATGIVVARLFRSVPPASPWFGRGGWFSISSLILMIVVLADASRIPLALVHNGLLLPLCATLIFGLALGGGIFARALSVSPLVFLGNASYAMYILHFPIGEWLLIVGKFFRYEGFEGIGWAAFYTSAVVFVSAVFYKFAERPLHQRLQKMLMARV